MLVPLLYLGGLIMKREIIKQIINYAKNSKLHLSIGFSENGIKQLENIDFNDKSFDDICVDVNDNLAFYNKFVKRWFLINITKIEYIGIHEKIIS